MDVSLPPVPTFSPPCWTPKKGTSKATKSMEALRFGAALKSLKIFSWLTEMDGNGIAQSDPAMILHRVWLRNAWPKHIAVLSCFASHFNGHHLIGVLSLKENCFEMSGTRDCSKQTRFSCKISAAVSPVA